MERGRLNYLFVFLVLVLVVNVINVSAESDFDVDNPESWYVYSDMMIDVPVDKLVEYADDTKVLFEYLNQKQREDFNKALLKKKLGEEISSSGLGDDGLRWDGDKLIGESGAVLDLSDLPRGLVGIKYDKVKGFSYEVKRGQSEVGSLSVDKGGYGADGFYDTGSILDGAEWDLIGDVVLENGIVSLDNGAMVSQGKITYSQTSEDKNGLVDFVSETRAVLTNAEAEYSGLGSVRAYDVPTLAIFDNGAVDYEYSTQYARLYSKGDITNADFYGKNQMDIILDKKFDEVRGRGLKDAGVNVFVSGENSEGIRIEFDGDETKFPRSVRDAKHSVDKIVNELDSENVFRLQKYKYNQVVEIPEEEGLKPKVFVEMIPADSVSGEKDAGTFLFNSDETVLAGKGLLKVDFHGVKVPMADYSLGSEGDGKRMTLTLKRPLTSEQVQGVLKSDRSGALEKMTERYEGKSVFEKISEFAEQAGEVGNAGAFVLKYSEESLNLASLIGSMSYDKVKGTLGNLEKGTKIIFDSSREPGTVTIEGFKDNLGNDPLHKQEIYPKEFVEVLVNALGERIGAINPEEN
ncbi:hypothetical protein HOE04_00460 [archaeon]|jgi:hypothetical protein|nr:hypothetical protein [archaeon]